MPRSRNCLTPRLCHVHCSSMNFSENPVTDKNIKMQDDELILDRDEFNMLKTLNTFVSIPGFSSKAMKIVCEEELQVDEDASTTAAETPSTTKPKVQMQEIIPEDIRSEDSKSSVKKTSNNQLFDYKVKTDAHKNYQYSKNRLKKSSATSRRERQLKTHDLTELTPRKKRV